MAYVLSDSDFDTLMGPVKEALAAFGKTVTASAKLIGTDVSSFIKLTCYWKIRSLSAQKDIMNNWKTDRKKHLETIYENQSAALEKLGPEAYAVMCMAPGLFWSESSFRGTKTLVGPETRQLVGEFGAKNLPLIGGIFGDQGYRGRSFWDRLTSGDATPGTKESGEELRTELAGWLGDNNMESHWLYPNKTTAPGGDSTWKNILYRVNDIFMLGMFDHHIVHGQIITEGDEKESKDILDDAETILIDALRNGFGDAYAEQRTAYLEAHKKTFEGVVSAVEKVLAMNINLGIAEDPDEFFKILDTAVKKNKELKDIDVGKITEEFKKMVVKLGNDEEVIKTLREELVKSGDLEKSENDNLEIGEKEKPIFEKKLRKIALDNVKGGFLNSLKEGVTDMYEATMAGVSDGLSDKTLDIIKQKAPKDKLALAYVDQIEDFHDRLNESISKLK